MHLVGHHMNSGWGGSATAWYVIDGLYCPWAGCDPMVGQMARRIEPWDPADPDCNDNGIPDYQELYDGTADDCNANGYLNPHPYTHLHPDPDTHADTPLADA